MQRFSVSLEDVVADRLRVAAARERLSVSVFVAGLVVGALTERDVSGPQGPPAGGKPSASASRSVSASDPGEAKPAVVLDPLESIFDKFPASGPSTFRPDPKGGK